MTLTGVGGAFRFFTLRWTGWDVPVALSAKASGLELREYIASLFPVGMRSLRYHCLARGL
jgi:vacuolar-type H+-ATPase subunit C/Vma6